MIFNLLKETPNCLIEKESEVCIVGGGTAGVYLSQALHQKNVNVILIELGGNSAVEADIAFDKPQFTATEYRGALQGRVAGLGGTSSKWGGQMISLSDSDFLRKDKLKDTTAWPIGKADLRFYYEKVLATLNMSEPKSYSFSESKTSKLISRSSLSDSFKLRSSSWIPFKKRNFAKGFRSIMAKSVNLEIWINAKLESMDESIWSGSSLKRLCFSGADNRSLVVSSKLFVFTMGALESTKHVLPLVRNGASPATPFCDHLSTSVGHLKIKNKALFLDYFSPFFINGIMRSMRFELTGSTQDSFKTASAFVHFITVHKEGSALSILRNLARKFQGEKVPLDLKNINIFSMLRDVLLIIYWRMIKSKLILNHGDDIEIVIDIEQRPNETNRISTSSDGLSLNWLVSKDDKDVVMKTAQAFMTGWSSTIELSELADIELFTDTELNVANYYDVYHPTGSLPFGDDPNTSLLNKDLRVWDTENLYVSSTAIFPTGGSANPGLTHLALTERLADHIVSQIIG